MSGRRVRPFLAALVFVTTACGGALAAWHYHRLGLTLTHYDARGHLVVARRIFDSITPGWQQIGAVWLPLPHLLNALPVQIDLFYRTGASAVFISIVAFAVAAGAVAWIVHALSGSIPAALAAAIVFACNPNVVYLQSTPMTEPLLIALTAAGIAALVEWCDGGIRDAVPGILLALACLTRYEAWPVTVAALTTTAWTRWRGGDTVEAACRRVAAVAVFPTVTIAAFTVFSRIVIGEWFVADGFFVPENKARGDVIVSAAEIWWGVHALSGPILVVLGTIGATALAATGLSLRRRANALIALSLAAAAAVAWAAFYKGHPFRIRYMVPLMAIEAVAAGILAGVIPSKRLSAAAALVLALVALRELKPLDTTAPMVVEAQWDRPNQPVRDEVTRCLGVLEPGAKIMASMGSLGHYMQEASVAGLGIRDFLHEGNGDIWLTALGDGPRPFADWVIIEEKAEGGDMLAKRALEKPHFLDGYVRVCQGAGLALYRRTPIASEVTLRKNGL